MSLPTIAGAGRCSTVALALLATVALAVSSPATARQPNGPAETAKTPGAKTPGGEANQKDVPGAKTEPGKELKKAEPDAKKKTVKPEGSMTLARMDTIIRRLDDKAKAPRPGSWQFTISDRPVIIVTDQLNNRMRIISPVSKAEGMPPELMKRLMQANFDTALDARYAIARGVIWATFIHPLRALHDRQFISAIGQTVNLAITFGTTFSSGEMSFGGGDSRDIIRKQLIEKLLKKGLPI